MKKITIALLAVISLCLILITLKLYIPSIPKNIINLKDLNNFISTARQRIQYIRLGKDWECVEKDGWLSLELCFFDIDSRGERKYENTNYHIFEGFAYLVTYKSIELVLMERYPSLEFCIKRMEFLTKKDTNMNWSKPYGCIINDDKDTKRRVYYKE